MLQAVIIKSPPSQALYLFTHIVVLLQFMAYLVPDVQKHTLSNSAYGVLARLYRYANGLSIFETRTLDSVRYAYTAALSGIVLLLPLYGLILMRRNKRQFSTIGIGEKAFFDLVYAMSEVLVLPLMVCFLFYVLGKVPDDGISYAATTNGELISGPVRLLASDIRIAVELFLHDRGV